jgi:hypothetical protein
MPLLEKRVTGEKQVKGFSVPLAALAGVSLPGQFAKVKLHYN